MPGTWSGSTCAANEVEQQKHQNTSTDCTVLNLIVMCVCLHEPNEISFKTHKDDTIEIACDVKEHHHSIIISAFGTAYMNRKHRMRARAHTNIESMQPFCESPNFFSIEYVNAS